MDDAALLFWHLGILNHKRYEALLERFGSLGEAWSNLTRGLLKSSGHREDTIERILKMAEEADLQKIKEDMIKRGIGLITIGQPDYPDMLRTIHDQPVFLSYRGDLSVLKNLCVALVGARDMSDYGARVAKAYADAFVRAGVTTVSGLAYGIDATVAKETLSAGGRTVAVLGQGMHHIYPRGHIALAEEIVAKGGLILSEFSLDQRSDLYTFPARNRIIAGLSKATVVLEAAEESGSLITAELASDYEREVFAVPGEIFDAHFAGSHALIHRDIARLTTTPGDVLATLGILASRGAPRVAPSFDSPEEKIVYDFLSLQPMTPDDLSMQTNIAPAVLSATLTMLELKGAAKSIAGGKWIRD